MPQPAALSARGTKRKSPVKKPKEPKSSQPRKRPHHAVGPIYQKKWNFREIGQYDPRIETHYPKPTVVPADMETGKPYTEGALTAKRQDPAWIPTFFMNPNTDLDYMVIEAITTSSIVGPLMSNLTKFTMGTGFRPELVLLKPDKDDDKNAKKLEEGQEIIDALMQIDRNIDQSTDGTSIPFVDNMSSLIDCTNTYNRSALVFGYGRPVEINGKSYPEIPDSLKFAHARDLDMIEVDPMTWNLKSVRWRNVTEMVPYNEMIYLWHPDDKYHNATWYGASMVLPMLDAARVLRKIIAQDFQAIAEATWARMPIITIAPEGQTAADKESEYANVLSRLVTGGPTLMMEYKDNVEVHDIDFNPKIDELVNMTQSLTNYCIACLGLPSSMFHDESASNRSTMIGKIQLAISTVINPLREMYSRQISAQWYMRWFRLLYADKPDILETYGVKMVFDNLQITDWVDKMEAMIELDGRHQLTDKAVSDLLNLPNYANMLDPDAETQPGGSNNSISWGDDKGNKFEVKGKKAKGPLGDTR